MRPDLPRSPIVLLAYLEVKIGPPT